MTAAPTIFVVDDDRTVCDSLRWLLESVGLQVETYASAGEFLAAYDPPRPGCLVLDVRMPGMSGLQLQEQLAARGVRLPIILVTGHGDVPMAVRAMKAGAVDFIEKPFDDQVLLERIQGCLANEAHEWDEEGKRRVIRYRLQMLTPREREVLDLVISGRQNKEIANALGISLKTVEVHRSRVMEKMRADSVAELTALCIAAGCIRKNPEAGSGNPQ